MRCSIRCLRSSWAVACLLAAWPSAPAAEDKPKEREPVVSTGRQFAELKPFDELMEGFVRDNELPGAALAVAKDGRLVYARGFGYADVEKKQSVQPESLFRIASISKPFTAVATLQLVEQGRLALDTPVFGLLPHKPHLAKRPTDRQPPKTANTGWNSAWVQA